MTNLTIADNANNVIATIAYPTYAQAVETLERLGRAARANERDVEGILVGVEWRAARMPGRETQFRNVW